MQSQATSRLLMIRPVRFAFNEQTAESNAFQNNKLAAQTKDVAQEDARREFDEMVRQLQAIGVNIMTYEDSVDPYTPTRFSRTTGCRFMPAEPLFSIQCKPKTVGSNGGQILSMTLPNATILPELLT